MPRSLSAARRALAGWHPDPDGPPPAKRQALYDDALVPGGLDGTALDRCGMGGRRVAVIGAGFAGAMAAWYLEAAGAQVSVFEAKDRVGGRVLTSRTIVPGKTVEAGAELIGRNHPLWFELAAAFGLSLVPLTTTDEYVSAGLDVRLRLGDHDLTDAEKAGLERDLTPVFAGLGRDAFGIDPVRPWSSVGRRGVRPTLGLRWTDPAFRRHLESGPDLPGVPDRERQLRPGGTPELPRPAGPDQRGTYR